MLWLCIWPILLIFAEAWVCMLAIEICVGPMCLWDTKCERTLLQYACCNYLSFKSHVTDLCCIPICGCARTGVASQDCILGTCLEWARYNHSILIGTIEGLDCLRYTSENMMLPVCVQHFCQFFYYSSLWLSVSLCNM